MRREGYLEASTMAGTLEPDGSPATAAGVGTRRRRRLDRKAPQQASTCEAQCVGRAMRGEYGQL